MEANQARRQERQGPDDFASPRRPLSKASGMIGGIELVAEEGIWETLIRGRMHGQLGIEANGRVGHCNRKESLYVADQ